MQGAASQRHNMIMCWQAIILNCSKTLGLPPKIITTLALASTVQLILELKQGTDIQAT